MREWVFTTKPEHFRMEEALIPGETIDWPSFSHFKFEPGDLVFFYASSPVAQMIGKTEIERTDLDFATEVNPRNDLRKWPKSHSRIPWLRLRVLQRAPIPFKPLQRGSLYYHADFKPSPYPKLLHEGEREYVMRAFEEAQSFDRDMTRYEGGLDPLALKRITGNSDSGRRLTTLTGAEIAGINYDRDAGKLTVRLVSPDGSKAELKFEDVVRVMWEHDRASDTVSGIRLKLDDTYLLCHIDGAELEVLAGRISMK